MKVKLLASVILFLVNLTYAQILGEAGRPFITIYSPQETGANPQSWAFVQDSRGVMYIGTAPGVVEYDGADWRTIPVSNRSFGRSLAIDDNGRIYVGAQADFGYLAPDESGRLKYVSLLQYLDDEDREFGYVWTTLITDHGIYFQALERIFRVTPPSSQNRSGTDPAQTNNDADWQIEIWKPKTRFNYAFWIDNTYYVQQGGIGLMKMVDDSLYLLPGGEQFADDRLQVMLPYSDSEKAVQSKLSGSSFKNLLIGTFNRGLFIYDGRSFRPFRTEADEFLKNSTIYDGKILPDGNYAFATINGGFVMLSPDGRALLYLNQTLGLPSNSILSLYVDRQGMIWLAPENGIAIIETPSPLSVYDAASGTSGSTYTVVRHKGKLYVGGANGVFYLDAESSSFNPVTGYEAGNPQAFHFLSMGETLLSAVGTGLYTVKNNTATILKRSLSLSFLPQYLHRSRLDSNCVFVGLFDGLAMIRYQDGQWKFEGRIPDIGEYIPSIVEPEPGTLWLGTSDRGTIRLRYSHNVLNNPEISRFNSRHGFPNDGGILVFLVDHQPLFSSTGGFYRFDEETQTFYPDTVFQKSRAQETTGVGILVEDSNGNVWVTLGDEIVFFERRQEALIRTDKKAIMRFSNLSVENIYPEDDGVVWFAGAESLIRFDPSVKKDYSRQYPALIRRVTVEPDSVLFGGTVPPGEDRSQNSFDLGQKLYAQYNALRFQYSATSFENPTETHYQSILEGFDDGWSTWNKEHSRNYTNLPPGEYKFRVIAQNIYQNTSQEASYAFSILPPWYRTWWAYGIYLIIFGGFVYATDRFQRRRLIKRERERSRLREAELRAEAAEAQAEVVEAQAKALQAENDRKKNVELLSEIGKEITSSLSLKNIIDTVYEHINTLMDAAVFGIGIYEEGNQVIEFPATREKGKSLPAFSYQMDDENRLAVWCFLNQKEVVINDYQKEYKKYIKEDLPAVAGEDPESIIYLPLLYKKRRIGVVTAQSFKKNAYTNFHLNILRNLATYTAIALDNAEAYRQLNATLENLKSTQEQLITQEKLASLGALTAGIAHEIKNPLNFVNNFSELTVDMADELQEEITKNQSSFTASDFENVRDLLITLKQNAGKIKEHGKRADSIVHSMLQHSRGKAGDKQHTDINAMLEEDLNLVFHGMRAQDSSFNCKIETKFDPDLPEIKVVPQDISRVFLNVLTNGCYEANRKKNETNNDFLPKVLVETRNMKDCVEIRIRDNGNGIPEAIQDSLFSPFFTTKPSGKGTGLGLSISYDIVVQEHKGQISFETENGEYTEFIIHLPITSN